jgi:hypothetical protein
LEGEVLASSGSGGRLIEEVDRIVQLLIENPALGARVDADLRHFALRRFPFSVVYAVTAEALYIVAIAHSSREPAYWQYRVQDR